METNGLFYREHYTHVITPVLVYAQRRLLERISYFGGPSVPQPHFTYTEMVTRKKVNKMLQAIVKDNIYSRHTRIILCNWHLSTGDL